MDISNEEISNQKIIISNCIFKDNKSTHKGGAIKLINSDSLKIYNSTFDKN